MKILRKTLSVIILIFLTCSFFACDFDESKNNLLGGELLNDEKMSLIQQEILEGEETETGAEDKSAENSSSSDESDTSFESDSDLNTIVYWTVTGSVWHKSPSCSHIKNNPNILAGTVRQAMEAEKTKACSRCCQ